MKSPIDHWAFPFSLAAAVTVIGLASALLLPWETSLRLMGERGPIENVTVVLYLLALGVLWLRAPPGLDRLSRIAVSILLLGSVAREMDLHTATFGISILKANFYRRYATAPQIVGALLMLLPILLSIGFLLMRHGRPLLDGIRGRRPAPVTTASIFIVLVFAKLADSSLRVLRKVGIDLASTSTRVVQLSIEEPLEMLLPLLVVVAIVQARRPLRSSTIDEWRSLQLKRIPAGKD